MARRVKFRPGGMELPPTVDAARALVRQARRRFDAGIVASHLRAPVWIAVLAAALYRIVFRVHAPIVAGVLMTIALAVGLTAGWRRRTTEREAAARVDRAAGAGGLLMTHLERPIGAWAPTLAPTLARVKPPPVAWRPIATVWNGGAFLALALFLPLPSAPTAKPNAAAAGRIEDLRGQLDALAQETGSEPALEEALAELRKELESGAFDAADWEATDALQAQLAQKAQEAEARLSRAARASQALEASLGEKGTAEEQAKRQEALEQALTELGASRPGSPSGATRGEKARSAEQLRRELQAREDRLSRAIAEARPGEKNGSKPGTGQGKPGPGDPQGDGTGRSDPNGEPGQPGSSPGGEAGTLVFDGPDPEDPRRLAFQPLPPGEGDADQLWGMTAADPRRPAGAWNDRTGAIAAGADAPAHGAQGLLPRNRALVQRYFRGVQGEGPNGDR